jgi:hypothetical protein
MCHVIFSLQMQRPEEGMVPCESSSRAHLGLLALTTNTVQFFKDFLAIGSSMGASHCKDEGGRIHI